MNGKDHAYRLNAASSRQVRCSSQSLNTGIGFGLILLDSFWNHVCSCESRKYCV